MGRAAQPGPKERLASGLARVIELRRTLHTDAAVNERWLAVKRWQAQRLARTYPDLLASARYRPACEFFLEELYGAKDFEARDNEALRVVPKLARMLPERASAGVTVAGCTTRWSSGCGRRGCSACGSPPKRARAPNVSIARPAGAMPG